jgi:hypothetical protein
VVAMVVAIEVAMVVARRRRLQAKSS